MAVNFSSKSTQEIEIGEDWIKIANIEQPYLLSFNTNGAIKIQRTNVDLITTPNELGHELVATNQIGNAILPSVEAIWVKSTSSMPVLASLTLN